MPKQKLSLSQTRVHETALVAFLREILPLLDQLLDKQSSTEKGLGVDVTLRRKWFRLGSLPLERASTLVARFLWKKLEPEANARTRASVFRCLKQFDFELRKNPRSEQEFCLSLQRLRRIPASKLEPLQPLGADETLVIKNLANPFTGKRIQVKFNVESRPSNMDSPVPRFVKYSSAQAVQRAQSGEEGLLDLSQILRRVELSQPESAGAVIISHFPADAAALLTTDHHTATFSNMVAPAVHTELYCIDGDRVIDAQHTQIETLLSSATAYWRSQMCPTLCWIDLSCIGLRNLQSHDYPKPLSDEEVVRFQRLFAMLAGFGHKMIVSLPRLSMAMASTEQLFHQFDSFFAAEPLYYKPHYPSPSGHPFACLSPVLNSNSPTLPRFLAKYFATRPLPSGEEYDIRTPAGMTEFIALSRYLTENGFLEVAFRIEIYCRTSESHGQHVPLACDYQTPSSWSGNHDESIHALLETSARIPMLTTRAMLTGHSGAGKTSLLNYIGHELAFPSSTVQQHWVPCLGDASLVKEPSLDVTILASLEKDANLAKGNSAIRLPCHSLLSNAKSLNALRCLFSNPLYLLIDRFDTRDKVRLSALVSDIRHFEQMGILVATRTTILPGFDDFTLIRLREMNNEQLLRFFERRNRTVSFNDILGALGAPIASYLRNPLLAKIICQVDVGETELKESTIHSLLKRFIDHQLASTGYSEAELYAAVVAMEALAAEDQQALPLPPVKSSDPDTLNVAIAAGLLQQELAEGTFRFSHELLRDYFVATYLDRLCKCDPAQELFEKYFPPESLQLREVEGICYILTSLLNESRQSAFILHLMRINPGLALRCLLGRPPSKSIVTETSHRVVIAFAGNNKWRKCNDPKERQRMLDSLSYLDDRLETNTSPNHMIEISNDSIKYRVSRYPVTNWEYYNYAKETGKALGFFANQVGFNMSNYPVVGISFDDAVSYCQWLSKKHAGFVYFLPSVEEWNLSACGSGSVSRLFSELRKKNASETDRISLLKELRSEWSELLREHLEQFQYNRYTPIGMFNPTPTGCFDMFGNVWQWCNTCRDPVDTALSPRDGGSELGVVVKGGRRCFNRLPDLVWMLEEGSFSPHVHNHDIGFRVYCRNECDHTERKDASA